MNTIGLLRMDSYHFAFKFFCLLALFVIPQWVHASNEENRTVQTSSGAFLLGAGLAANNYLDLGTDHGARRIIVASVSGYLGYRNWIRPTSGIKVGVQGSAGEAVYFHLEDSTGKYDPEYIGTNAAGDFSGSTLSMVTSAHWMIGLGSVVLEPGIGFTLGLHTSPSSKGRYQAAAWTGGPRTFFYPNALFGATYQLPWRDKFSVTAGFAAGANSSSVQILLGLTAMMAIQPGSK